MVIKAKKGLYDNLSRKELQSMCRLYGLPPNKKSLIAFLEEGINGSISNLQKASHSKAQRKSCAEKCLSFSKEDVLEFRPENECRDVVHSFSSPIGSARSSTFQLYVRSEDGLNLYVDLNSSLSDWTKKFKREIHILENETVQQSKSWSLHNDLACLKDELRSCCEKISSEEIRDENIDQDRPEMISLDPFSVQTLSISVDVSGKSMENQPQSCHVISVADFCDKGRFTADLDSDAIDPPDERKFTDDDIMQNDDSSIPNPRFSVSSSIEDESGLNCDNGEPVGDFDVKDNKESGLTNSCESNHLPVSAEERERSNILNERESSECSQFTKTSEKACFDSGNLDSNGGHQKKRKRVEAEHQSDYAQPNVKILRSMKRKKDLPRRSMRLMSK